MHDILSHPEGFGHQAALGGVHVDVWTYPSNRKLSPILVRPTFGGMADSALSNFAIWPR